MTYVSHPVRRIREDPIEDASVTLVVTAADEDAAGDLADRLADVGTVEERLEFGAVAVTVEQTDVDTVCDLSNVDSVVTANTLGISGDAGEDVEHDS